MAGKAKKKAEKRRPLPWLKFLLPALALPVVVIGGLYAGVILLTDSPQPPETQTAEAEPGAAAREERAPEQPAPQGVWASGPKGPTAPIDMDKLRITDTVISDTRIVPEKLDDNKALEDVPQEETPLPETIEKEAPKADPAPETDVETAAVEPAAASPERPASQTSKSEGQAQVIPPLWLRNATAPRASQGQPMIAVVIDDIGPNLRNARRAITLPAPLTLAFLPYANHLDDLTAKARQAGHELIVHMPMEPEESSQNPGENALLNELGPEELQRRIRWNLERFSGYVGVNNHMGSKFTKSGPGMRLVMAELSKRGLLFLDSRTNAKSQAEQAAALFRVPFAQRDIFIDNDYKNPAAIRAQLAKLEERARSKGYAVGIGHPHNGTLEALATWMPEARKRGFAMVPISEIVKQRLQLARAAVPATSGPGTVIDQP